MKRISGWMLALLLTLGLAATACADADWRALYAERLVELKAGARLTVALTDLTGDAIPEMAVFSADKAGMGALSVYTAQGNEMTKMTASGQAFSFASFAPAGVLGASFQLRAGKGKVPCLSTIVTSQEDGVKRAYLIGLASSSQTALEPVIYGVKEASGENLRFSLGGKQVTQLKYAKAKKAFQDAYKKKGSALSTRQIAPGASAAQVQKAVNQLGKKFQSAGTVKAIKINKTRLSIAPGATYQLKTAVSPATAVTDALTWSSSDSSIATVNAGLVTAVSSGHAMITVRAQSGASKNCEVTVTGGAQTLGVTLDQSEITLFKNATQTLTATVSPVGASTALTWKSSDAGVAKVNQKGVVTAVAKGSAVVTATTKSGKSAACKVTVKNASGMIVDISEHNDASRMDWATIAKNVDLLILRCGVTRTYTAPIGIGVDNKFTLYAKKCKEYDIPFGVYYYGKVSTPAKAAKEAQMAWDTASPYNPLFYVYDAEESCLDRSVIESFVSTLKSLGAKKTGLYVAHHLYETYNLDTSIVDFIWIPNYSTTPKYDCDIHQYSSQGKVAGFPGVVDVNRLTGVRSLSWFLSK